MGVTTNISWCDHTFNPWRGCAKVATGCENCYAETFSHRNPGTLGIWGTEAQGATRVLASEAMWKEPVKWNDKASCRRCQECESSDHHWLEHWSQESESDHSCKHCNAVADGCLECCNGYAFAAAGDHAWDHTGGVTDSPCRHCDGAGVTNVRRRRPRVFCASLCDVFEDWQGPMVDSKGRPLFTINGDEWFTEAEYPDCRPLTMNDIRRNLFDLIDATPNLDWLLLTKRPENVRRKWCQIRNAPVSQLGQPIYRKNVWLGTSVAAQADVGENVPALLGCRDMVAKLFVSVEPLVGRVDLRPWIGKLNWVIVGGESGPSARPCHVDWIRSLVDQCRQTGVACHVKQLGANPVHGNQKHPKGGDPSEWPEDLQIQEFPVT